MVNAQILSITQGKGLGLGLGECSDLIYHSGENTERARARARARRVSENPPSHVTDRSIAALGIYMNRLVHIRIESPEIELAVQKFSCYR